MDAYLPYKPIHDVEWLEKYLKKNFYKKKYDRFMWWRSYTLRNAPLSDLHPLRDRISNGDFDLGSFTFEIELVEHRLNDKYKKLGHDQVQYLEAVQLDKARLKRLQEDRDKDEKTKLDKLRRAFVLEFNMTKKQYDRESGRPNNSIVSFYDKMEKRFGKRGWATRQKPKNLRLASERSA